MTVRVNISIKSIGWESRSHLSAPSLQDGGRLFPSGALDCEMDPPHSVIMGELM